MNLPILDFGFWILDWIRLQIQHPTSAIQNRYSHADPALWLWITWRKRRVQRQIRGLLSSTTRTYARWPGTNCWSGFASSACNSNGGTSTFRPLGSLGSVGI